MPEPTPETSRENTPENPERVTSATTPEGVDGTTEGNPIAGVEIDEAEREQAVEPGSDALEVDGPQAGHA